ncbi:MAG: SMC-Scp complex subunit ScpB [Candidatus Omnitrophota bacterium]
MDEFNLKKIIEALMFVSEKPLNFKQILEICSETELSEVKDAMNQLQEHYNLHERGIHIREVAGGYQFSSNPDCADYLKKLYKTRRVFRLSAPALETLAIIAYKQPITRSEIEFIRGVNVDGVVKNLEDRDLVKIKGRKEVPGKPLLYGTTDTFLHYFGLKSLQGLPSLEEFKAQNMEYVQDEQPLVLEESTAGIAVDQDTENSINNENAIAQDTGDALVSDENEEVFENGEEDDGKSEHKEAARSN